jgi:hypothetical protein
MIRKADFQIGRIPGTGSRWIPCWKDLDTGTSIFEFSEVDPNYTGTGINQRNSKNYIFAETEDDYSPTPMSCGDCDFETHYESELFAHLKVHIGKQDEVAAFF